MHRRHKRLCEHEMWCGKKEGNTYERYDLLIGINKLGREEMDGSPKYNDITKRHWWIRIVFDLKIARIANKGKDKEGSRRRIVSTEEVFTRMTRITGSENSKLSAFISSDPRAWASRPNHSWRTKEVHKSGQHSNGDETNISNQV